MTPNLSHGVRVQELLAGGGIGSRRLSARRAQAMSSPFAADIVIPVFDEGPNIRTVLDSLKATRSRSVC